MKKKLLKNNCENIVCYYLTLTAVLILQLFVHTSCSSGEGSGVLEFFFDGVEEIERKSDLDTLALSDNLKRREKLRIRSLESIYFHEPYRSKGCDNCHENMSSNKLIEPQPDLCYNCHDDFSTQYVVLHGPVASGYCTGCHHPHTAKIDKLLRREGKQMCYNCHQEEDVMHNEVHLEIEDSDCTDCHNPHGGEDRFLL